MEEKFKEALMELSKQRLVEYICQIKFERDFLQAQLDYDLFSPDYLAPQINKELKGKLWPDEVGVLIEDFIAYVCAVKGHKIGVGHALIQRYIDELYGVKDK